MAGRVKDEFWYQCSSIKGEKEKKNGARNMSGALARPARRISASIRRRLPSEACQPGLRPTTAITPQRYQRNNSSRRRPSAGWDSMPLAPGASILLTVALCSVFADSPAEAGWWPFSNRQPASPFNNTIPRKAKKQRAKAEVQMRKYLAKMRVPVQELMAGLRKGEVRLRVGGTTITLVGDRRYHIPWTGFQRSICSTRHTVRD